MKKIIYTIPPYVLKSLYAVSIFVLFFLGSITYKQILSLNDSEKWVIHSKDVHIEVIQLLSIMKDAETGQRGFLLTHDSAFLQPYNSAFVKAQTNLHAIKNLLADNNQPLQNLDSLSNLINERFVQIENILVENTTKLPSDSLQKKLVAGKNLMDKIRLITSKMIDEETKLLALRQMKHAHDIMLSPLLFFLTFVFSLSIFVGAFYLIQRDVKNLKKINNQLLLTHETFEHAEQIANMGNWCWNMEANTYSFSNNYYRLLGCQPHEFAPTLENILQFVHPDDLAFVKEQGNKIITQPGPATTYYRVIRKDGAVRHFKSVGKIIIDDYGKKIRIGVNADVTDQHLTDRMLEEKLAQLEQSNKELQSFNHVASHDLQEPLRKIQTFISRIEENSFAALPEKNKEYFSRIKSAAHRMQLLINDLLAYSRANKEDGVFEITNLNETIENTKQEFATIIEELNATIQSSPLPRLSAIPFQMQQLFNNLIGNALKYTQPNVSPVITIQAEIVAGSQLPLELINTKGKFYKISIADNGIGFEQEYADKIFNLFSRLHANKEYAGTGIGLTICKKIVENHKGIITAAGKVNEGAVFTIFLPV